MDIKHTLKLIMMTIILTKISIKQWKGERYLVMEIEQEKYRRLSIPSHQTILKNTNLSNVIKLNIYKTNIRPVTINAAVVNRLRQQAFIRKISKNNAYDFFKTCRTLTRFIYAKRCTFVTCTCKFYCFGYKVLGIFF